MSTTTLQFHETPDTIIVSFTDAKILYELRIQEAGIGLCESCQHAADAAKDLIVDFRGVEFMSSAMLGKLVLLNKKAKACAVNFRMANVGPNVLELFKIARLNRVFRIEGDDPDLQGSPVPMPKPPGTLGGRADPPAS